MMPSSNRCSVIALYIAQEIPERSDIDEPGFRF